MPTRKQKIMRQRKRNTRYRAKPTRALVVPYKYRQLFKLLTTAGDDTDRGFIDARFDPWSFSKFYTANPQSTPVALDEPKDYQKNQFDYYRPSYIKIKYTPTSNRSGPYQSGSVNTAGFENLVPPVYVVFDPDNIGASPEIQSMVTRDYCKQVNMSRPWTVKFRLPNVIQDQQSAKPFGWNNVQAEAGNTAGVIWIKSDQQYIDDKGNPLGDAGDGGREVGEFLVTYYCSFKNRQYHAIINTTKNADKLTDPVPTGAMHFNE